jgi:hypothetical protein
MNRLLAVTQVGVDVLSSPAPGFESIKRKPRSWWVPVTLVIGASVVYWSIYFGTVDMAWLSHKALEPLQGKLDSHALERMSQAITPRVLIAEALAGKVLTLSFTVAVIAAYLRVVSQWQVRETPTPLQWLALAAWSRLPELAGYVGSGLRMAIGPHQRLAAEQLSITSAAGFMSSAPVGGVAGFLANYDLLRLWELALLVVGYAVYTGVPRRRAMVTVLAPWLLLTGAHLLYLGWK